MIAPSPAELVFILAGALLLAAALVGVGMRLGRWLDRKIGDFFGGGDS